MEKATRQLLIAGPDCTEKEKALEKQAKIDAQVAKMQAGLKVWKAGQKMPELEGSESELEEVAHA
jgi:CO dehydrogenase/acetyl-CoA synthase epsilon subunit